MLGGIIFYLHNLIFSNQFCKQTRNSRHIFLLKFKQSSCLAIVDGIYSVEIPKDSLFLSGFVLFLDPTYAIL